MLRPAQTEGWDDNSSIDCICLVDNSFQLTFDIVRRGVNSIPVRRFSDENITALHWLGITQQRQASPSEVTRKYNLFNNTMFFNLKFCNR